MLQTLFYSTGNPTLNNIILTSLFLQSRTPIISLHYLLDLSTIMKSVSTTMTSYETKRRCKTAQQRKNNKHRGQTRSEKQMVRGGTLLNAKRSGHPGLSLKTQGFTLYK